MNVDPFLQPSNGPNYFPFDPSVVYQIKIDNDQDAQADVTLQFRFQTHILDPGLPVGFAGAGNGVDAPANSPPPAKPGTPIVPPAITSLTGDGAAGLSLQQTFTVNMIKGNRNIALTNTTGNPLIAVPTNIGPRTMPDYDALAAQGIYNLQGREGASDIRVFAGTVADPFFIDLGATFDSLNYRAYAAPVLKLLLRHRTQNDQLNSAPDSVFRIQRQHHRDRDSHCAFDQRRSHPCLQQIRRELSASGQQLPGHRSPFLHLQTLPKTMATWLRYSALAIH